MNQDTMLNRIAFLILIIMGCVLISGVYEVIMFLCK
jgi:hypothetical protein